MYPDWHVHGTGAVLRKKKRLILYLDVVNMNTKNCCSLSAVFSFGEEWEKMLYDQLLIVRWDDWHQLDLCVSVVQKYGVAIMKIVKVACNVH